MTWALIISGLAITQVLKTVGIQDKEITLNLLKDIEELVTNARVEDRMTMKQRIEIGTTDFGFFELNEPDENEEED